MHVNVTVNNKLSRHDDVNDAGADDEDAFVAVPTGDSRLGRLGYSRLLRTSAAARFPIRGRR